MEGESPHPLPANTFLAPKLFWAVTWGLVISYSIIFRNFSQKIQISFPDARDVITKSCGYLRLWGDRPPKNQFSWFHSALILRELIARMYKLTSRRNPEIVRSTPRPREMRAYCASANFCHFAREFWRNIGIFTRGTRCNKNKIPKMKRKWLFLGYHF